MKPRPSTAALILLLAAVAAFIWRTSAALPPLVASHFTASGTANGFMPRDVYVVVLLTIGLAVPLLLGFLPAAAARAGGGNLRIPNRDYWLTPERRETSVAFIRLHGQCFAAAVAVFIGYVHWLVVLANGRQPPELSSSAISAGLVAFLVTTTLWLLALFARFRRRA